MLNKRKVMPQNMCEAQSDPTTSTLVRPPGLCITVKRWLAVNISPSIVCITRFTTELDALLPSSLDKVFKGEAQFIAVGVRILDAIKPT